MTKLIFGECDCCGENNRVLSLCVVSGIDTAACNPCRGYPIEDLDEADDIADEIERLVPIAESGEDWAHICALEVRMIECRKPHGQFGVGA